MNMTDDRFEIAPSYAMQLIEDIVTAVFDKYKTYKKVESYIKRFQEEYWNGNFLNGVSFEIEYKEKGKIDVESTLHNIDSETLLKIAIDLGIDTPDFIPAFPTFRNVIKENKNLKQVFDTAYKHVMDDPALAIANANSALESLCKDILKKHSEEYNERDTLKELVEKVLRLFGQFPNAKQDKDIKTIGSGLIKVASAIEKMRSDKTPAHGKAHDDEMVEDSIYAHFILNAVATLGLYFDSYNKHRIGDVADKNTDIYPDTDDIDPDDIPF